MIIGNKYKSTHYANYGLEASLLHVDSMGNCRLKDKFGHVIALNKMWLVDVKSPANPYKQRLSGREAVTCPLGLCCYVAVAKVNVK